MVAYSFQPRFVPLIESGTKTQTIRADRKRHARPGETLQLYTGMRTRSCRLIREAECVSVTPIRLDFERTQSIVIGEEDALMTPCARDLFARRDGFTDWLDLVAFWRRHHPDIDVFSGVLIRWTLGSGME
jgi:uncharacterized protein YqfB (UPF0267 family)